MTTYLDELERRHDGHIPAALRREAARLDAAAAKLRALEPVPPSALPPPPKRPSPEFRIALMARLMIERAAGHGACLDSDLASAGFAADEVAQFGPSARVLAAARMADRVTA